MSERYLHVTPAEFAQLQEAAGDARLLDGRPNEAGWLSSVQHIVGSPPASWGPLPGPIAVVVRHDVDFLPMYHCGVLRWATAEDVAKERPSMMKRGQEATRERVARARAGAREP